MPPRHLDPRVKLVWLAPEAIAIAVIWLVASTAYLLLSVDFGLLQGVPRLFVPPLLLVALLAVVGLPSYIWHQLTYVNFTYELVEHEVIIREGVLTRKRTVIPYGRIQNINTERTLFERMLGLSTIRIETAGANQSVSEGMIPGIGNRDELVNEILGFVERTKKGSGLEPEKEEKPSGEGAAKKPAPQDGQAVLAEILEELKEIKLLMKTQAEEKVDFSEMREKAEKEKELELASEDFHAVRDEPEFRRQISKILKGRKKPK